MSRQIHSDSLQQALQQIHIKPASRKQYLLQSDHNEKNYTVLLFVSRDMYVLF